MRPSVRRAGVSVRVGAMECEREMPAFVRGERVGPVGGRERPDGDRVGPSDEYKGERGLAFVGVSSAGPEEDVKAKACAASESGAAAGGARSEPLSAASAAGSAGASAQWRRQSGQSGTRQRMAG
jgi:hypothetical protein